MDFFGRFEEGVWISLCSTMVRALIYQTGGAMPQKMDLKMDVIEKKVEMQLLTGTLDSLRT